MRFAESAEDGPSKPVQQTPETDDPMPPGTLEEPPPSRPDDPVPPLPPDSEPKLPVREPVTPPPAGDPPSREPTRIV
jgi:hypothetical protein